MKRVTVALDLDGVIWDLLTAWVDYYNLMYDDSVKVNDITDYDVTKTMLKASREEVCDILTLNTFWSNVQPFEESYEYLSKLNREYNLVIATKSDYRLFKTKVDRLLSLFPFLTHHQIICIDDKSLLNVDWLIDDFVENLKSGNFKKILIDAPYNRDVREFLKARNLKDVYNILKEYYKMESKDGKDLHN